MRGQDPKTLSALYTFCPRLITALVQHISLGTHETEAGAARAYDAELAKLPGDTRPLNFPGELERAPGPPLPPQPPATR